jgi:hypothetical protein
MYLYPLRLLSWRNYQQYWERIGQNGRHKKLLPLIRRYTLTSRRLERATRKDNNDIEERSQVKYILVFLFDV